MLELATQSTQNIKSAQSVGQAVLIVNARARQGHENFRLALQELQEQGIRLVEAYAIANPAHLKPLAQRLLENKLVDTIIVGGGDGTLSVLADLLAHRNVRLGIIPMGTANDFARNLAITTNIQQAVGIIRAGYVRETDLGYAGNRYFLNVASIGLGVEVAGRMDADLKKMIGPLAYGAAAFEALSEMRPVKVRLTFKDRPHGSGFESVQFQALQLAVANGRYYGGGMVSAPTATVDNKQLNITVIENMGMLELLQILPGLRDGSYVEHPKVHHFTSTNLFVETGRSRQVNLDGEVCQRTPLYFTIAPGALKVFAPQDIY